MYTKPSYYLIRAWGQYMGSTSDYINAMVDAAQSQNAPENAIFLGPDNKWRTINVIKDGWKREWLLKEAGIAQMCNTDQRQKCSCGHDLYMVGNCNVNGCSNSFKICNNVVNVVEKITDRAEIESLIHSEISRDLEDYGEHDFHTASTVLIREGWQFVALSPCSCVNYSEDVGHSPSCGWYPIEAQKEVI